VNDPIAILKRDHREASALLQELADSSPGAKRRRTCEKLDAALRLHMQIEELEIYPLVRNLVGEEEAEEAEIEHGLVRAGLEELAQLVDEPGFGAAVAMITAGVKHHVKEEEREVFPELKSRLDRDQLAALGDRVTAMKNPAQTPSRARATSS
jgi:hemerythrin-like domain-containing protein